MIKLPCSDTKKNCLKQVSINGKRFEISEVEIIGGYLAVTKSDKIDLILKKVNPDDIEYVRNFLKVDK